jgi:hypothetical protein
MACAVFVLPEVIAEPNCGSTFPNGVSLESAEIHSPVVTFVLLSSVPLAYNLSPMLIAVPVIGLWLELA